MSCSNRPAVSVIIASYRHEQYVEQTIKSIWSQSRSDFEIIVVDDASPGETPHIVRGLIPSSPVPMRLITKAHNQGASHSLNTGIALAAAPWIAVCSSDDFYERDKLACQLAEAVERGPSCRIVHTDGYHVDPDSVRLRRVFEQPPGPLEGPAFDHLLRADRRVISTSVMFEKELALSIGGFDETMVAEDFDFFLRCARHTDFAFVDRPLINVRVGAGSLGRQPWLWSDGLLRAIEKHRDLEGYEWDGVIASKRIWGLTGYLEWAGPGRLVRELAATTRDATYAGKLPELGRRLLHSTPRAALHRVKRRLAV